MGLKYLPIHDALAQLRKLAEAIPRPGCDWESRPSFLPPPTTEELDRALQSIPERLPDDLAEFLRLCGGINAMSVHNGYHLCGASELIKMNMQSDGWPPREVSENGNTEPVFTVALDGGGNVFLLSPRSGNVWRWDHETGMTIRIAPSFSVFLQRVVEDWTAYVENRRPWTFLV